MNILFTSVGRRSYLVKYFREALNGKGTIHVANSNALNPTFQVADKYVVTPLIYDERYIDFLKEYCINNSIDVIISLFDVDLPVLAKHRSEFADIGVRVIVSDVDVINICNDKWKTYCFLKKNGFVVPETYLSIEEILSDIKQGKVTYPIIIKPRWGMGSLSIMQADDERELRVFYDKVYREIQKTYLKYEAQENLHQCIIMQEKINGQEFGLDVINDLKGNYQTTIVKEKYAMRSGETDCAKVVKDSVAEDLGKQISNRLNHVANLDVDIFKVKETFYILEMNARFGGGYPFSHLAGVNLPKAIIDWAELGKTNSKNFEYRVGVVGHKDISLVEIKNNYLE